MRAVAMAAAAVLALVSAPVAAQQAYPYQNEISVFGTWDKVDEPVEIEVTNVQLRYGRYLSPQIVGTAALSRTRFETNTSDDVTTALMVGAKYYFSQLRAQALVPFVDGAIGLANTDSGGSDSTDFTWEVGGGVAYFISERTSLDASIRLYQTSTDAETEGTRLFVGLTTRF
ncbi:MAG TPA: outer membrane beta-barrel protein [Burkholderiales bacterium]